ncbi:MAG: hypothetical protein CVU44_00625 [Chloroflexi bacterium HGW-Chloroflexi-6]|nr:MAG: hypothetical protein CVU44_00625 [Chloroflexi bacterium HGW-Chloroflexi-6]
MIHRESNIDYTILGQVMFGNSTRSSFEGDFIEENGASHPISFYFDGPAIHFILENAQGRIFGTGMMESSLTTCFGSGGGTLSGPAQGDLGDWRGEWVQDKKEIPEPQEEQDSLPWDTLRYLCNGFPFAATGLLVAYVLFRIFAAYKPQPLFSKGFSSTRKTSNTSLRKVNQDPKQKAGNSGGSLVEYLATYTTDDKLFDLYFEIEKSAQYLGDCGVTVAKIPSILPGQVAALEFWLFDVHDHKTTAAKILMSDFCYNQQDLRSELEKKGSVVLTQPGEIIELTTKGLIAKAKVLQVEYDPDNPNPNSVFKKVVIKIGVWAKTD